MFFPGTFFFLFLVPLKKYFLSYTESLHTAFVASSTSELRGLEPKCKISQTQGIYNILPKNFFTVVKIFVWTDVKW